MLLSLTSCATMRGTMSGGIANFHEHIDKKGKEYFLPECELLLPVLVPLQLARLGLTIPCGTFKGFFYGLRADIYKLEHGNYPQEYEGMRPWKANYEEE